jgi:1-acyl-sn-glycerol-3-phosphate acyltransferase
MRPGSSLSDRLSGARVVRDTNDARRPLIFRRQIIQPALRAYMRLWHHLTVDGPGRLPEHGPALLVGNHASFLDLPVYMAIDPYPDSTILVLASMLRKPVISQAMRAWDVVSVTRDGRDTASLGAAAAALAAGRVVVASAEGKRSRTARFERVHPVLAFLASRADAPVIPLAVVGSYDAMPYGVFFPRPRKIVVRVGEPISFPTRCSPHDGAAYISRAIAALLPPEQQPIDPPPAASGPMRSSVQ